ncbi:hypothetical protein EXE42_08255 [Halorubrum sp. SP3]|uniref:hypothetical protein n=1 Tax=Halorubrum sp. SP3 TaxID=1537265 RepID=UPI0010F48A00|nr:hypothetical protein [Halorubrum sp. SP3]TKX54472.1 hypothetical protein EXE42_08255 [Halorubrum sp. SP3]
MTIKHRATCPECDYTGEPKLMNGAARDADEHRDETGHAAKIERAGVTDGGVSRDDLKECWCCDGLHDNPGTLCPNCSDAGCNRFTDGCESDHKPALPDGGREPGEGESYDCAGHVRPVPPHVPPTPEVDDVE